ncbi:MAG: hypothetical protein B7Z41_08565 [Rhizobiales bacterium 12-66-7]|nr:MAG: hypothetical protein B7Z41_08565 [Rhizobiales bacterium 12-66-7]
MRWKIETPALLLDRARLEANAARMRTRCAALGVRLRPHLKTAKSINVACVALADGAPCLTVSTLKEAEYLAAAGYADILYATAIAPQKLAHAARIQAGGADLLLVADSLAVVEAAEGFCARSGTILSFLVEIDCGEHRSGLLPDQPEVVELARAIADAPHLRFRGVMTHAGHSYASDKIADVVRTAAAERDAAVKAAEAIRAAGIPVEIVSVGSTPTVLHADHLHGVTEVRCGIYMFWDLAQVSRHICGLDDIAVSVLATVIGHNRAARALILDAGALALSKDLGANTFLPDVRYGYVCDAATGQRLGALSVASVHQEHGHVPVEDPAWFDRLPVGATVRILPNHACLTCAAYDRYEVVEQGIVTGRWPRISGW